MERIAETTLRKIALITIPVVGLFACFFLGAGGIFWLQSREAIVAAERSKSVQVMNHILQQGDDAMNTVNAPCADNGHQYVCGTLAGVNQAVKNTGILAAQGAEQINQSGQLIQVTATNINAAGDSVKVVAGKLSDTASAATGTLQASTTTIQHAQPVLDNAAEFVGNLDEETKPVIANANVFLGNANTLATNPNITLLLGDAHQLMLTGNHMLATGDAVETKITRCTLHPTFWCDLKGNVLFGAQVGGYLLH